MIIPSRNMKTVVTWQIFDWTSHHKSVCSLSVSLCLSLSLLPIYDYIIWRHISNLTLEIRFHKMCLSSQSAEKVFAQRCIVEE